MTETPRRIERWFYLGVAAAMIVLSFTGFSPSIADQSKRNALPTPLVIAHGGLAFGWLLLFLTQATLVATRRIGVHRRLGALGYALGPAMIAVGCVAVVEMTRRGYDLSGDLDRVLRAPGAPPLPVETVLFPVAELLTFGVLAAAGLWYRHRPDVHKRFMLLALIPLAQEPVNHVLGHLVASWPTWFRAGRSISRAAGPALAILFLSVSAIHDRLSEGRVHPVSLWVPLLLLAWMFVLPSVVFPSVAWHQFAAWIVR